MLNLKFIFLFTILQKKKKKGKVRYSEEVDFIYSLTKFSLVSLAIVWR